MKGVVGVFADLKLVMGRYYLMYSKQGGGNIQLTWHKADLKFLLSTFQGNAYVTRRFRMPVAWPKVVSDRHYLISYKVATVSVELEHMEWCAL